MILDYDDDSIRIVVSTANLIDSDWQNRTQALWVSPKCPKGEGDSPTLFKASLIRYLEFYQISYLNQYIKKINESDFSKINAFFIGSVPGSHNGPALSHFGHMRVGSILRKELKPCKWPLIVQCSSIGTLGNLPEWLNEVANSLAPNNKDIKLVYPSKKNVFQSIEGVFGGGCLPYKKSQHEKQPWLRDYFYQWKSDRCGI